jgi:hypothetical protein
MTSICTSVLKQGFMTRVLANEQARAILSHLGLACREVSSIFFSFRPIANICSAVLKLHSIRFATHEKAHYVAMNYTNVLQIQNDVAVVRLAFKKPPQPGYRLFFDSATQDKRGESPSSRGLDPKCHRLGHLTDIVVRVGLTAFLPFHNR